MDTSVLCSYLVWRSRWVESAGTHQEGVRLRFALLHVRVIAQNDVVKQSEEVFVLARLQLEGHAGRAGGHRDGDVVLA